VVIDCHCHGGKGEGLQAPWDTEAPLGPYLRRARAAGIGRTVIFPTFSKDYARANVALARIAAEHPGRFICFASVNPQVDAGRVHSMVHGAVRRLGFRGIKVHGHEGTITREICEAAAELGVPILYDIVGRTEVLEMVATQYPSVPFIIPHLGSFLDDWKVHVELIRQLRRYPNVYADTSGVRRFDYLVQAVREAGPGKLLFGSDGPWLHPGLELHKIRLLGLPPPQEALITGHNVLRLIRGVRNISRANSRATA